MYRGRLWTMRQYAGFASARETNCRFHVLLEGGQTGLSTAFDLPTQIGYDSDHPLAIDEVGKVGVPINSLADMERLFEGIPLGSVSTVARKFGRTVDIKRSCSSASTKLELGSRSSARTSSMNLPRLSGKAVLFCILASVAHASLLSIRGY